ncbi:uncharacterized protein [Diadema setosum]|uniref:uncharacterized protein n=1 Tax=Diadema setosum TaxID=31175 RepID=UPI003B3BAF3F
MMLLLASVMLLCGGLSNVGAITCNMCMEMSSTNAVLQAGLAAAEGAGAEGTGAPMSMSCQTPVPMTCDKCMTQQFTFTFTSDTYGDGTLTMTQLGCSDPSMDSELGADNCLPPEMVTMIADQITQSAGQGGNLPPGITVTGTTGSLCVCDTDNCNVVPEAAASNPTGAAPSMMAGSAEPQAGDGAEQDTTMQTTTAGAVHVLASATVLIASLLSAIVFRAV